MLSRFGLLDYQKANDTSSNKKYMVIWLKIYKYILNYIIISNPLKVMIIEYKFKIIPYYYIISKIITSLLK